MPSYNLQEVIDEFLEACRYDGWSYSVRDSIVTITKNFPPGSNADYIAADAVSFHILGLLPAGTGSTWGTDGGSVGGGVGLAKGFYTLNRSGVHKRVCDKLRNT